MEYATLMSTLPEVNMMAVREIRGEIRLTLVVEKEGNAFASYCVELGTASEGDTPQEALDNIREAVQVHIGALEEVGTRERVFKEKGIEILPATVEDITPERTSVKIPVYA